MAEEEPVVAEADLTDAALKDLAAQADQAAKPAAPPAQRRPAQLQPEWSYAPGDRVLVRSMRNGGPHSATIETP